MPTPPTSTLLLGDCLLRMQEISDASVDMVLADLPYGTTQNKWDSIIPLDQLWFAWKRICRPGAPIILFTAQPFTTTVAASNLRNLRTELIWEKPQGTNFLNARRVPMKVHENILVFCDRTPPYYPQMTTGSPYLSGKHKGSSNYGAFDGDRQFTNAGTRYPRSVLRFKPERGHHPTQKPVSLLEWLIKTYSLPGALVLDPTIGSGSTGVACMNTGRLFVGIEMDATYFKLAQDRIAVVTPKPVDLPEAA